MYLATAGLAGNRSHEESKSCVLQQGLASVVAAGGGVVTVVVTVPALSIKWGPLHQLA